MLKGLVFYVTLKRFVDLLPVWEKFFYTELNVLAFTDLPDYMDQKRKFKFTNMYDMLW